MKHTLPDLPYAYNALEPYIDETTMRIHHTKHHQTYVDQLNFALEKYPEYKEQPLIQLLQAIDSLPNDIRTAVRNHGGGHFNHSLFWNILKNNPSKTPKGKLLIAINESFGSFETFKTAFSNAAKTRFGSGWAWLIVDHNKMLEVTSTANQDTPLAEGTPILGIDVWEHAYYLKYQNKRPNYIDAFWNVINWDAVEKEYEKLV